MMQQKSTKTAWIDFLICLFFGIYGIHKFCKKKIGLGILYLFTGGLFVFGWLYDCAKLFGIAINSPSSDSTTTDGINFKEAIKIKSFFTAHWKKIALIIGAAYLLLFVTIIACLPNMNTADSSEPLNGATTTPNSTGDSPSGTITDPFFGGITGSPTTSTTEPLTEPVTEPPHVHNFSAATCTTPKTCSCGATDGSANGHDWKDATCTTPKTCSVCGVTSGSTSKHTYTNGKCSVCGSNDPNYSAETETTYVLNLKSKKFHRLSCSRLPTDNREDTTMDRDEIINAGYDPCGYCDP